jgi:hypothetical protein
MSDRDRQVHVLGWEKWRAGWIDQTGTATGKTLTRVGKPPSGSPIVNQTHTLRPLDSNANGVKMVAIELADGLHYTAEYRRRQDLDAALPDEGVVLVKANDRINQGEGPAIVQESPVTLGNLDDAPFVTAVPRNRFNDLGSGVDVEVTSITPAQAQIRLNYEVPATQNDVFVAPHDDRWETVDIWVDAPDLSLDLEADPRTVRTANEKPVIGFVNHVAGRVRNLGRADATNLEVELEILEPWGTGGTWRSLKVDTVPLLQGQDTNPSHDYVIVANWTPTAGEHTCVKLRVRTVPNDVNPANNETQENIHEFVTEPGSPYDPVISRFQFENPYNETLPILFRLDGLPADWSYLLAPERPTLAAGATGSGQITLQPPEGAPLCSREEITLTAWVPRVDTLKRLGGLTLAVELKNAAEVTAETRTECKPVRGRLYTAVAADAAYAGGLDGGGGFAACRLVTRGCTDPGLPNTQIAIGYSAPDGGTAVRYVVTDEAGCYVDVIPGAAAGLWQADVVLEEEDCRAGDRVSTRPVLVPIGFGRARYLGVFSGGNWPLDGLDDYSPSFTFSAQVEWPLSGRLRLGTQIGYHAFDAEPSAGVDNLGFTNVSAIARWLAGGTAIRPFALVGAGGYHADGHWDPGLEAGVGFEVPLTDSVSLAAGVTAHSVDQSARDGREPRWMDAYLGFFVALP